MSRPRRRDAPRCRPVRRPDRDRSPTCRRGRSARSAAAGSCRDRWRAPPRARRPRRRPPVAPRYHRKCLLSSTLPLATQFSATPPARQSFDRPYLLAQRAAQPQHHLFGHRLDRGGDVHMELGERLVRRAHRSAEQLREPLVRHRQAGAVVEIVLSSAGTSRPPSRR